MGSSLSSIDPLNLHEAVIFICTHYWTESRVWHFSVLVGLERPLDDGGDDLVLKDEEPDPVDDEDEDEEDGYVLDPAPLDELPETRSVARQGLRKADLTVNMHIDIRNMKDISV